MNGKQIVGALLALLIVVVGVAVPMVIGMQNDTTLQRACIEQGGVWAQKTCAWSDILDLGDREAVITVEEDGSYPAGCVPGRLCDDSAVKP